MFQALPMAPPELRFMGRSDKEFVRVGTNLARAMKDLAGLAGDDSILDVGCGYGRVAHALWSQGHRGHYLGVDVLPRHIQWCQENMTPASGGRYEFVHVDVYNSRYNRAGNLDASEVNFDFGIKADFVLVASVFTHILPAALENYLVQIAKVLREGGRVLATFFLMNESQRWFEAENLSRFPLEHQLTDFARYWSAEEPLHVIAFDQEWVMSHVESAGLTVDSIHLGSWCGRPDPAAFQDTLVLRK